MSAEKIANTEDEGKLGTAKQKAPREKRKKQSPNPPNPPSNPPKGGYLPLPGRGESELLIYECPDEECETKVGFRAIPESEPLCPIHGVPLEARTRTGS